MYLKNTNFAIYLSLAAVVGFGVCFLCFGQSAQDSLLSGDISKASRYNNVKEDPEFSVIEEKLKSDAEFRKNTEEALKILSHRVKSLSELTDCTVEACKDIPEFSEIVKKMTSLNAKAYNTGLALDMATEGLGKLADGKTAPEYEQASNNAFVGFQKVENQLETGKAFVETATKYLENNDNKKIADLVAVWSVYCAQDACMNAQKENVAYWSNKMAECAANDALCASFDGVSCIISGKDVMNSQVTQISQELATLCNSLTTIDGATPIKANDVVNNAGVERLAANSDMVSQATQVLYSNEITQNIGKLMAGFSTISAPGIMVQSNPMMATEIVGLKSSSTVNAVGPRE